LRDPVYRFEFHKRRQFLIRAHNKTLSVVAMCFTGSRQNPFLIAGRQMIRLSFGYDSRSGNATIVRATQTALKGLRMHCRFCNQEKPALAKAHIIPRSFFKSVRGKGKYSVEMRVSEKAVKEKYHQAGNYDSRILCEECERKFSLYDAHGHSVFTKVFEERRIYRDPAGRDCAYFLPDVDFRLLKLFVLGVLWRASVSSLDLFSNVDLGRHHEHTIKSLIFSGTIEGADHYQFFCLHQRDNPHSNVILPPWKRRMDSINYIQLYLPNIQIVVKMDQRPLPEIFAPIVITPKPPQYLVFMAFRGSTEANYFDGIKCALRAHQWATK
jgi:hypothetical protein